jgi:hypothetical protein
VQQQPELLVIVEYHNGVAGCDRKFFDTDVRDPGFAMRAR